MSVAFSFFPEHVERQLHLDSQFASAPTAENSGDDARATTAMQYCDDSEGLLIGRVCNYVIAHGLKPQRLRGEVGTALPDIRKRNKRLDRLVDFLTDKIGRASCSER